LPYGYYDVAPYSCAPYGYYGPEWFSGGVFMGVGPWFHGPHDFHGHVDNRFDPHHGYKGPHPDRGDKALITSTETRCVMGAATQAGATQAEATQAEPCRRRPSLETATTQSKWVLRSGSERSCQMLGRSNPSLDKLAGELELDTASAVGHLHLDVHTVVSPADVARKEFEGDFLSFFDVVGNRHGAVLDWRRACL